MILLFPYTLFTLTSHLPAHEVEQTLKAEVAPRKLIRGISRQNKLFTGEVANGRFNIKLNFTPFPLYRNTFRPIIIGQVDDDKNITRIEVTMRISYPIYLIVALILFLTPHWIIAFFSMLLSSNHNEFLPSYVSFVGILLLGYVSGLFLFNYEANKARRYLEEIFRVNTVNF